MTLPDVRLRPMTGGEFEAWHNHAMQEYAKDKMQSLNIPPAQAERLSRESFASLLPGGLATPDHFLFTIESREHGAVGVLWFGLSEEWGMKTAFVYDLEIIEAHRRKGYAAAAMTALEVKAREHAADKIALHVFGQNEAARDLYAKVGYRITDYSMAKTLD